MDYKAVSKAIAGAVVAIVAGQLAKWLGTAYSPELDGAIRVLVDVLVTGVLGYAVVYLAPKNKEILPESGNM